MARTTTPCPCGGGDYDACCGRWHVGAAAPDAEALMRSRYSAYVLGDSAYLLATWHRETRPVTLDLEAEPQPKWLGLEVKRYQLLDGAHAQVEFVARYKVNGRAYRMRETSRFTRLDGRWYYLDGEVDTA